MSAAIGGKVLARGDEGYELWRRSMSWNARPPSEYPELIVQPRTVDDAVAAVKHARASGLKVAARSGGHSWCHASIREGAMLIDLARFRGLEIDPQTGTAMAGPALTARELQQQLGRHALAFPTAHCGSVPLGGYLLGGGQAWNGKAWGGRACYSVIAFDMVDANGEVLHVSEAEHPELLWAARGAGPGFCGLITRFQLRLYPLPRAITVCDYVFPLTRAPQAARWLSAAVEALPREVETLAFLAGAAPGLPDRCAPHGRAFYVSATAFADSEAQARAALAPLLGSVPEAECLLRDELRASSFEALFDTVEASFTRDRCVADTLWSDAPLATLLEESVDHFAASPSPLSMVLCEVHPAGQRFPDAAFSMHAGTSMHWYSRWRDAAADADNIDWLRAAMQRLEPRTVGRFVSETDMAYQPRRAREAFTPQHWERLQAVRKKYDPDAVFHGFPEQ